MSKRGELYVLPSFFVKEVKVSNEIQEKLLEAIDVLINNRLNQLDSSTTITATITGVLNNSNTQYSCEGNGDKFNATSAEDTSFAIGDSVYVLMSNERNLILGKVAADDTAEATLAIKNNYYSLGGNFSTLENYFGAVGISSYKKSDGKLIYELNNENSLINFSDLELAKFARYMTESDALLLQATFQTNLPIQQTRNVTGVYGLKVVLNFEQDDVQWTKTLYLNSSTMAGNPYQYTSPTQQYTIFKLREGEGRAFKNIQSIEFIGGNFVAIDDATKEDENIFCSNIKLTCLEPINKTDGYYIVINAPEGSCFNTTGNIADESLTITAEAYYNKTNISAACNYSWFVQDGRIDVGNIDYRAAAGAGWRYIGSEDIAKVFLASENQAEKNNYLCIATYNNQIIIKQPFNLFNIASNLSNVKIYSVDGKVNFSFNNAMANLLCTINDDTIFNTSYSFSWYKVENGIYNLIVDEITAKANYERMKQALQEKKASILDVSNASSAVNASKGVVITSNKLSYPVKNIIEDQITFVCQAYRNNVFIGQGNITLTNTKDSTNKIVVIENGNQVFQYNEAGVSPCSSSAKQIQEILPLTAQAFNMVDDPVSNNDIRSVTWRFPLTSKSMIVPPAEAELSNENYYINTTIDQPVSFTIKDNYDIFATENQITVIIQTRSGIVYTGSTNFTFTKIGNFGNNGTDLVAKIKPTANVDNLILYLNKKRNETSNRFYEDGANENEPSHIRINILYDGITNKEIEITEQNEGNFKSVVKALESLENVVDRASKCEAWAEYVKQKYLTNKITTESSDFEKERYRVSRTLYLDLRQVARNMKTVDELLFDYLDNYKSTFTFNKWNINEEKPSLKVTLYQSGVEVIPTRVRWSILGSTTRSKFLRVAAKEGDFTQCEISARTIANPSGNEDPNTIDVGMINNLLIQAEVTLVDEQGIENTCYNVYPINLIVYNNFEQTPLPEFTIIEDQTLRSVMYDSDGRNPVYNSKRGAAITTTGTFTYRYWFAEGGVLDSTATAPMTIDKDETDSLSCNIIPNNTYNGEAANTNVHIILYEPEEGSTFNNLTSIFKEYGKPKIDIYIPIHFYLNRYGLASLNAWDGNHLEVNEEENYILAPQIGAGKKESDNTFTGLVMGEAKFYNDINEATGEVQPTSSTGLLGYAHGKQSVFINAEDGSAIFGLPEQRAAAENSYTEGRIVIQPGGESKIGMWTIGSRSLYNINKGLEPVDRDGSIIADEEEAKKSPYITAVGYNPSELKGKYLGNKEDNDNYGYAPYRRSFIKNNQEIEWKDSKKGAYDIPNASVVIPPEAQGLVLSANPAFISAKTMPLHHTDDANKVNTVFEDQETGKRYLLTDINLDAADTILDEGDSLEVQINPNSTSPFGVFRHTKYPLEEDIPEDYRGKYYRYPLMGINHNGQLFVNSLQNGETNLKIGQIAAFGSQSNTTNRNSPYLGHRFVYIDEKDTEQTVSKMFVNKTNDNSPLYITTGISTDNEYSRPIHMHGKEIRLYADANKNITTEASHRLIISDNEIELGHLQSSKLFALNRSVKIVENKFVDGWQVYQDISFKGENPPVFEYYGSIFENNLKEKYSYDQGTKVLTPGKNYYILDSNNQIKAYLENEISNDFIKITRQDSGFSLSDNIPIKKACIPTHWTENGIIDAVYVNGTRIDNGSSDETKKTKCHYYYYNDQNESETIQSNIAAGMLLGQSYNSVLNLLIKIILSPISGFTIEQLDLNKYFTYIPTKPGTGGLGGGTGTKNPDYPQNLSAYTLNLSDLTNNAIRVEGNYLPPAGYSLYKAENDFPNDLSLLLENYIKTSRFIFLRNERNSEGALRNNNNELEIYWLNTLNRDYLQNLSGLTITRTADIPIVDLVEFKDVNQNSWAAYQNILSEKENVVDSSANYLKIGNSQRELTNSELNLPTNNFSLDVQNGLFRLEVKNNSSVLVNASKGMSLNTLGNTEIILSGSGNLNLRNVKDKNDIVRLNLEKENDKGKFILESKYKSSTLTSIESDETGLLKIFSQGNTVHKVNGSYKLGAALGDGISLFAYGNTSEDYNTGSASLILAPGSASGTFNIRGGNSLILGNINGVRIESSSQKIIMKAHGAWVSVHRDDSTSGKYVLQTNGDLYLNGRDNDQHKNLGTITCGNVYATYGNSTINLREHKHPFSMAGTVNFYKAGYTKSVSAGEARTVYTQKQVHPKVITAWLRRRDNKKAEGATAQLTLYPGVQDSTTAIVNDTFEVFLTAYDKGDQSTLVNADASPVTLYTSTGGSVNIPAVDTSFEFKVGPVNKLTNWSTTTDNGFTMKVTTASLGAPQ